MFGLLTARRHDRELLAAHAETARMRAQRDTARSERDAFKKAAMTAARIVDQGDVYAEGGRPSSTPTPPSTAALRERDRARALEQRLAALQAINERCTCGGAA